jgi:hypothetical protein
MARPKKEIDEDIVFKLASFGCTREEIAAVCNCHVNTIDNRFSALIKEGQYHRNATLRILQFRSAKKGNVAMQIWLGKNCLNQSDKVEHSSEVTAKEAAEQARQIYNDRIASRVNGKSPVVDGVSE